jgi:protein-tyrosine phosphatase
MRAPQIAASVANLRDLGGLATTSGREVAAGRLFRSSHFGGLVAADEPAVHALGLRTVVDFRGVHERAAAPNRLPVSVPGMTGWHDLHLPIEPSALAAMSRLREAGDVDEAALVSVMHGVYQRFVERQAPVFSALLQQLLQAERYPLVFHCTAGKDRTGFAAALVLAALGVPREAIVDDFLLSNQRWTGHAPPPDAPAGQDWTVLSRVRAGYLQRAFDTIDRGWGSTEAYLAQALNFDAAARERLASHLLVEGPVRSA